jgi:hypothetical protein
VNYLTTSIREEIEEDEYEDKEQKKEFRGSLNLDSKDD